MKVSVVIVNYKVPDFVYQCLCSLKKALADFNHEIFVVDNNSNDGSVSFLKKWFPDVRFIENDDNIGFSKANNVALNLALGQYVLILNPDTFVPEDMIVKCVDFLDNNNDAGALGVKMYSAKGQYAPESKRGIPKPFTAFCKLIGLCKLFPKNKVFGKYYLGNLDPDKINKVEILSGACMFVRREALLKTGFFDEDYFMYGEDIDLSYRFLKAGFQNYYFPVKIIHYKGESTQKVSYQYVNNFNKSMIIFFRKHFNVYSWLLELPILATVYLKAAMGYIKVGLIKAFSFKKKLQENDNARFLVFSENESEKVSVVSILAKSGYQADVILINDEIRIHGHNVIDNIGKNYDFVVYNTKSFQYKQIIDFFTANDEGEEVQMALFYPELNKIITPVKVLDY